MSIAAASDALASLVTAAGDTDPDAGPQTDKGAAAKNAADKPPVEAPTNVAADLPPCLKSASVKFTFQNSQDEVYSVRFSPDDSFLAVSFGDGTIGLNHTTTGRHAFFLGGEQKGEKKKKGDSVILPSTCLRWRPVPTRSKADLMVSVTSDGGVSLWHVSARKRIAEVVEEGNQLFCVDYAADASTFTTGGQDQCLRVYDENTMKVVQTLTGGDCKSAAGHSNRIFALKYHPIHPNIIVTGSWDKKVQFWDTRVGYSVRAFYGPLVSGDSLDISGDGNMVLTGSCRTQEQLQLWDYGTSKLIEDIPMLTEDGKDSKMKIYCAQFAKSRGSEFNTDSLMMAAGGSNPDEMKLFDLASKKNFFDIEGLKNGCYSLDFSRNSDMLAVASGDGRVQVLQVCKGESQSGSWK